MSDSEEVITLDNGDEDFIIEENDDFAKEINKIDEEKPEDSIDNIKEKSNNKENGNSENNKKKTAEEKVKEEHFSHNKPDEFSSENFKIEIGGLPKYYPLGHLKKLLNVTLQLDAHRVKPGGLNKNVAYANFKNEEVKTKAKLILDGYKWQNSTLTAIDADPAKDPMLLAKIDFLKVPKKEHEALPLIERITKAVTPFHDMSYEDQIKEKDKVVKQVMKKFGNELSQINPELVDFVHWQKIRRKGQVCEMDEFIPSPIQAGYRNKCEFTIGNNKESQDPVVGFRVASYKEGSVEVGPISHLNHLNDQMKETVKSMEQYLKDSEHKPFDPFSHEGIWRQLTIRTSNNNDLMIVVVIHPQELGEVVIQEIKDSLVNFFTTGAGAEVGVTSIFFQQYGQRESGKEVDYEHLWGKEYIEETILGKTFRASPDAFLQVNTPACELLYSKIAEVLEIDPTTVLLDICCGVGTIGLSVAESAYKVFGVEMTETAVDNARINCQNNEITNAVFYHGKAEDYIDNMIERSERVNTVAVVDPPRAGLNGSVMNALRKCEYLDKLVYISCDPQAALANFQALGRPRSKAYKGSYFVPIRATPIDLFPDTPHFELVIVFERYDECKWDRIMAGNPRPKDQKYFDRVPELKYDPEQVKKDREEKRQKEREERRKVDDRGRNDQWVGGGGGSWGGGRDMDRIRGRDRGRGGPRNWSGQGGPRGWGGDEVLERRRDDYDRPPKPYREQFGVGFQEGFQAGLEALGAGAAAGIPPNVSGFGQGGGWNMAQTQGRYALGEDFSTNEMDDHSAGGGTWGARGGFRGTAGGSYSSNNPALGGAMISSTGYNKGGMGGYHSGGVASSNWNSGGNVQLGSPWYQQNQSFDGPASKKWKGANNKGYNSYDNY